MLSIFLKWHHRLGVLTLVAVLLWGLSAVSHPVMSRLQAKPAHAMPPDQRINLGDAQALPALLRQQGWKQVQGASLATVADHAYYRVTLSGDQAAHYLDVHSGQTLPDGERLHAQELARYYTGLNTAGLISVQRITAFSNDYHPTNRLLPVWRVQFDQADGLTAYIDVDQARLATLVDNRRRGMTGWFQFGHDWTFFDGMPALRLVAMTLALALAVFSSLSGMWFFVRLRSSASKRLATKPMARWHRWLGIVVGITTVAFACSGALHLWMGERRDALAVAPVATPVVPVARLSDAAWQTVQGMPLARLQLLAQGHKVVWLIQAARKGQASGPQAQVGRLAQEAHAEHNGGMGGQGKGMPPVVMLHDATTGAMLDSNLTDWATEQALAFAAQATGQGQAMPKAINAEWVTRFGDEYGFVNKRLPVVRVTMDDRDHTRYYIEPATNTLAARVDNLDAFEGQVFSWAHKWRFADANKDVRDILQVLVVLVTVGVSVLGLLLFIKRSRARPSV